MYKKTSKNKSIILEVVLHILMGKIKSKAGREEREKKKGGGKRMGELERKNMSFMFLMENLTLR